MTLATSSKIRGYHSYDDERLHKQIESRTYGFIICTATSSLNLDRVIKVSVPSLEPPLKDFVALLMVLMTCGNLGGRHT